MGQFIKYMSYFILERNFIKTDAIESKWQREKDGIMAVKMDLLVFCVLIRWRKKSLFEEALWRSELVEKLNQVFPMYSYAWTILEEQEIVVQVHVQYRKLVIIYLHKAFYLYQWSDLKQKTRGIISFWRDMWLYKMFFHLIVGIISSVALMILRPFLEKGGKLWEES